MTSSRIRKLDSSIRSIMSRLPVSFQMRNSSTRVFSDTSQASSSVCRVSVGMARRQTSRFWAVCTTSGPQSGKKSGCSMSGDTWVPVDMTL